MHFLRFNAPGFQKKLKALSRTAAAPRQVVATVTEILHAVRTEGDSALLAYTAKFGGPVMKAAKMKITSPECDSAERETSREIKDAIRLAHSNVRAFAMRGLRKDWQMRNAQGVRVGETFHPYERVGIYVPGGNAPLISTALMTVTLAAAAGVPQIVVTTPADANGCVHPALTHALRFAGATEVYKVGGAQAIAAMAFGTKTIPPVVKIFGPGNAYVVEAKRQVFGTVAIDLLPGPSEILVIADDTADSAWIAADLLAQAEHGHGSVVFITDSPRLLAETGLAVKQQMRQAGRREHLRHVLDEALFFLLVKSLDDAVVIANDFAPEHVAIIAREEELLAAGIRTAGAIFVGRWSPVAGGDFVAGPSHELPTGGSGKSFSGLTVDQFQRRMSTVRFDKSSLQKSLQAIQVLSAAEGLDRHGASASLRLQG